MPRQPTLLIRPSLLEPGEEAVLHAAAARHGVVVTDSVVGCANALVVSRLATWPYYGEVERDLRRQGSTMVQPLAAHERITSMAWADVLGPERTPPVFRTLQEVPRDSGPWVVKGRVTSRKLRWNEEMFAPTWADVIRIQGQLERDTLIGEQGIVVRPYVPLRVLERGLFDLPFANEHRCVFYRGRLLGTGFYWDAMTEQRGELTAAGLARAQEAADLLAGEIPLAVLDVAERADGTWLVVEVNDLQQSGFGSQDLPRLYDRLCQAVADEARGE